MEKKISPSSSVAYLISVKSKTSNDKGEVYVIFASSLDAFVESHLTPDVVLLIDTINTFGLNF
jgi:hypothetical protein